MKPLHIVIIGAGFGGVYTARYLACSEPRRGALAITLISRSNHFLFTPLLHEVATGSLSPRSVVESLHDILAGRQVKICQGEVDSINTLSKVVTVDGKNISYDYLVIATGADTNFYNTPGAEQYGLTLKNLSEAVRMRSRIITAFEQATLIDDMAERQKLLSFVVVGGGATGVELAAELIDFIHNIESRYYIKDHHRCQAQEASVTLVSAQTELLTSFDKFFSKVAVRHLQRQGIKICLEVSVSAVGFDYIELSNGTRQNAGVVLWVAGVSPNLPQFVGVTPECRSGRIVVNAYLQVSDMLNVFVLGDAAAVAQSVDGTLVPMLAQAAVAQARVVATNILANITGQPKQEFNYRYKGALVSLGKWFAVGEIGPIKFSGKLAWWIWRTVYLFKFLSWRKRFSIAIEWTVNLFSVRDITKLT